MHPLLEAHIKAKQFHHAYLLCGYFEVCRRAALGAAETILSADDNIGAHPDFSQRRFELFGIDDSRELKAWATTRSFYGNGKVFVAEINAFNNESTNALLKLFEEPNSGIYFFIIVPSVEIVMPTLRSRMTVLQFETEASNLSLESAENFFKNLPNKRMEIVKKLSNEKKEKKADKAKIVDFLNSLEMFIEEKIRKEKSGYGKTGKALKELQKSREFVFDKGVSFKIILEHLALALPKF